MSLGSMNLDTCVHEIKGVVSKFATQIKNEKDERYEECRINMEVIETLPIVQFYKRRVAELTKELEQYKKSQKSQKSQKQITINIEEKECENIDICGDERCFDLDKTNVIIDLDNEPDEDEDEDEEDEIINIENVNDNVVISNRNHPKSMFEKCEKCSIDINCYKENVYILTKKLSPSSDEDCCLCLSCYELNKDDMKLDGWLCDDFTDDEDKNKNEVIVIDDDEEEEEEEIKFSEEELEYYKSISVNTNNEEEEEEEEVVVEEEEEEEGQTDGEEEVVVEEEEEEEEEGQTDGEEEVVVEEEEEGQTDEEGEEEEDEEEEEEEEVVVEEEEEEEEEEEDEEVVVEEEEEEEEEVEEEEVEEEVFEHEINGKSYYVTDLDNGIIYSIEDDEDIGSQVGTFKNSVAVFD